MDEWKSRVPAVCVFIYTYILAKRLLNIKIISLNLIEIKETTSERPCQCWEVARALLTQMS